jgi:DNA adenine methylase
MGSKARIAKDILPIILKDRESDQWYIELFVGGANLIDKVEGKRAGFDINPYLIEALKLIRDNPESLPKDNKEFTEQMYKDIKNNKDANRALTGIAGFSYSYGAKWFGGWRRDSEARRDYVAESYRNALIQSPKLQGVHFATASYDRVPLPKSPAIIFCDPPYANTTKYKDKFDHDKFWQWCRETSKIHKVFICEYTAPDDFECIWSKEIISSLTKDTGSKKGIERLFIYKGEST